MTSFGAEILINFLLTLKLQFSSTIKCLKSDQNGLKQYQLLLSIKANSVEQLDIEQILMTREISI